MDMQNRLTCVFFQPVTLGDTTGYQVYYNETMMNVNSLTTTLTFAAPSLTDDAFNGTVVVIVIATSGYGIGPASEPEAAVIYGRKFKFLMMCIIKEYLSLKT